MARAHQKDAVTLDVALVNDAVVRVWAKLEGDLHVALPDVRVHKERGRQATHLAMHVETALHTLQMDVPLGVVVVVDSKIAGADAEEC